MKKSFSILAMLFLSLGLYAQEQKQKITINSPEFKEYNDGRHKGLDFSLRTGFMLGVGDAKGADMIPIDLSLGKQISDKLYFGLATGAWIGAKENSSTLIPIALDTKLMFPSPTSNTKFNFGLRLGYLVATDDKVSDMIVGELMPGIQFPISKSADFMLSLGYTHAFATKSGGGDMGFFAAKIGFNFHKNPFHVKKGPRREKVDTRDKGLQFTIEGGFNPSPKKNYYDEAYGEGFFSLACTYKLNPRFAVGGGIAYEHSEPFARNYDDEASSDNYDVQYIGTNYGGGMEERFGFLNTGINSFKVYARGVYRPFDTRLSPIASLDLGIRCMEYENGYYSLDYGEWHRSFDLLDEPSKIGFYAQPAIGLSLRTTKNSYLELKGSILLASKFKGIKTYVPNDYDNSQLYFSARDKAPNKSLFVSLGFTHTFGKRGKRLR